MLTQSEISEKVAAALWSAASRFRPESEARQWYEERWADQEEWRAMAAVMVGLLRADHIVLVDGGAK